MQLKTPLQLVADQAAMTLWPESGALITQLRLQSNNHAGQVRDCLYFPREKMADARLVSELVGGLPWIFPNFGRHEPKKYPLPMHGFSWRLPWQVERQEADAVTLSLRASPETWRVYPFEFHIRWRLCLSATVLYSLHEITNRSSVPMPFSAGFHPYLLLDAEKEHTQLVLNALSHHHYLPGFLELGPSMAPLTMPRYLNDPVLKDLLTEVAHPVARLISPTGVCLAVAAWSDREPQYRYIQLYDDSDNSDQQFYCVEPIISPPNSLNNDQHTVYLAPGATHRSRFGLFLTD